MLPGLQASKGSGCLLRVLLSSGRNLSFGFVPLPVSSSDAMARHSLGSKAVLSKQ